MSWYKKVEVMDKPDGPLKTFSFSGLKEFETCPFKRYLKKVGGFREESGPAAARGSQYHDQIEHYIRGDVEQLPKMKDSCVDYINEIRKMYANEGNVILEENWFIDKQWDIATQDDFWGIFIIDCFVRESETSAKIVDWKTGKSRNNEMKHAEQLMFYAICAFERFPELEYITATCLYIDEGHTLAERSFTREKLVPMKKQVTKRAMIMTTATEFVPMPSRDNCRWCEYKTREDDNGQVLCQWGVIT